MQKRKRRGMHLLCRHNKNQARKIGQILELIQQCPEIRTMDNVLNDDINSNEHGKSENRDEIYSKTSDHENLNKSTLKIISSFSDGAE